MAKTMTTKTRERLVTRTIITCVYKCMVVTPENQVSEETVVLGNVTSEKPEKIERILREKCQNIFVKINDMETAETLMGMPEDEFIAHAHAIER